MARAANSCFTGVGIRNMYYAFVTLGITQIEQTNIVWIKLFLYSRLHNFLGVATPRLVLKSHCDETCIVGPLLVLAADEEALPLSPPSK